MAKGAVRITTEGFTELSAALDIYTQREAQNLMRATIGGVASDLAKEMKANAPVDTGGLKRSIKVKREKTSPNKPSVRIEGDFFWRFLNYGTIKNEADPFVTNAVQEYKSNERQIIKDQFAKKLEKLIARKAKKAAKK